jgi:hypothetical protein
VCIYAPLKQEIGEQTLESVCFLLEFLNIRNIGN